MPDSVCRLAPSVDLDDEVGWRWESGPPMWHYAWTPKCFQDSRPSPRTSAEALWRGVPR